MAEYRYGSVDAFVRDFVCVTFTRPLGSEHGRFWDAEWWRHPEAVLRLEALWHAWEAAQDEPGGMSSWLRDHADYHLGVLMAGDGPFGGSVHRSAAGEPLPYTAPPSGMFPEGGADPAPKRALDDR